MNPANLKLARIARARTLGLGRWLLARREGDVQWMHVEHAEINPHGDTTVVRLSGITEPLYLGSKDKVIVS